MKPAIVILIASLLLACQPATEQQTSQSQSTVDKTANTAESPQTTSAAPRHATSQQVVSEDAPLPGEYGILYGTLGTREQAEEMIRELRAQRVNCFIYKTPDKKFGVFIGRYPSRDAAQKQLGRLREKGIENLSLYYLGGK